MVERTDEELLSAAGRGDRGAFGELVERHHRAVVHFVHRFIGSGDRGTVEDLAQDVFLNAWKAARSFSPRAKVLTWLLHIAKNTCLNYQRRQRLRRTAPLDEDEIPGGLGRSTEAGELQVVADEQAARIRTALAELPAFVGYRQFYGGVIVHSAAVYRID